MEICKDTCPAKQENDVQHCYTHYTARPLYIGYPGSKIMWLLKEAAIVGGFDNSKKYGLMCSQTKKS